MFSLVHLMLCFYACSLAIYFLFLVTICTPEEKGFVVAIMMDTEGNEIHMGELGGAPSAKTEDGEIWIFSAQAFDSPCPESTININYDGFTEDVKVSDELLMDSGMVRFDVIEKIGPNVKCLCTDPGLLLPRANLTFWRDGSLL